VRVGMCLFFLFFAERRVTVAIAVQYDRSSDSDRRG
jgi:hypothetical protein